MIEYLHYEPGLFGPFVERWKDIVGFEGIYFISDYGRVKSFKNGILKLNHEKGSYTSVKLCDRKNNNFRRVDVHILVGEHFIPNPEKKKTINHKLGFKDQNFVGEIEWNTYSENGLHGFRVLGRVQHQHDKRKVKLIYISGGIETPSKGIRATAKLLNIPYQAIQNILKGKNQTYSGYSFKKIIV